MISIASLIFNPFRENTYVVWDATGECVIVDAGNSSPAEDRALADFVAEKGLRPVMALNTHGHVDHLLGVGYVTEKWGVPFVLGAGDGFLVETAANQAAMYGLQMRGGAPTVSRELKDGDEVRFGDSVLKVISTPGHTPGHICLLGDGMVLTGDTLFRESIGRTDLPGGDYRWIMESIIDRLLPLGTDIAVHPGHGPATTIGHETLYNPFITEVLGGEVKAG
jgi:glyoxylase-like metal-dependent hydrolase (beta-lactamase superfamily II)